MIEIKSIWTIGHSTRTLEELLELLHSFQVDVVVDVRSYPGSRRYPHFNKDALEISLPENGIQYLNFKGLGGRRKARPDTVNTSWRNDAFRGYADYMDTTEFRDAVEELELTGGQYRTAYMCSEAVWWRCHRSMISDYLKAQGWQVMHILANGKAQEHPYTAPARILNGKLTYNPSL